jgi:hypothetical protein
MFDERRRAQTHRERRMKYITNGVTLDTRMATLVASGTCEDNEFDFGIVTETVLYSNPAGLFFAIDGIERTRMIYSISDDMAHSKTSGSFKWSIVGDAAAALKLCESKKLTIWEDEPGGGTPLRCTAELDGLRKPVGAPPACFSRGGLGR